MIDLNSIAQMRWFMGKGQPIRHLDEMDSTTIGGCKLQILQVEFENGSRDLYAAVDDESRMGALLTEGFCGAPSVQIYKGGEGQFVFSRASRIDRDSLAQAVSLGIEQSNSAFFVEGKYFFKLFRRLHAGIHPEQETLTHLNRNKFNGVPQVLGQAEYQKKGNSYAIGILENHVAGAKNAWDLFSQKEQDPESLGNAAFEIGCATARMHDALKNLKGTAQCPEEPPFDKLIWLLNASNKKNLIPLVKEILRRQDALENDSSRPRLFTPQRIHGDFHLGQVLLKNGNFTILDFEGEPARSLDYRRRLRNPAVDIAGMLRSFAYAEAVQQAQETDSGTPKTGIFDHGVYFLMGYSKETGIPIKQLEEETRPFILGKAIYEACYELEYRPKWFWIPEKALKSLIFKA